VGEKKEAAKLSDFTTDLIEDARQDLSKKQFERDNGQGQRKLLNI